MPDLQSSFAPKAFVIIGCSLLMGLASHAEEKKPEPIGVLLAAGDIAECLSAKDEKKLKDKNEKVRKAAKENANNKTGAATAELIQQQIAKYPNTEVRILALGDLAYPHGESFDCFNKTWGKFKDKILPAPGNHDFETDGGKPYRTYFAATLKAVKAQGNRATYAVDFPSADKLAPGQKSWRLFALSSNEPGTQKDWLQSEMSKIKGQRCVLAFAHAFAYSSGRHGHADKKGKAQNSVIDLTRPLLPGNMMELFRILHANSASVFIAGHDHHYEQLGRANAEAMAADRGASAIVKDGIRSFIVGTGGTGLHGNDYEHKWEFQEAYDLKSRGILKIVLYSTSYDWEFIPTKDNKDSLKIVKDVARSDTCNLL